MRGRPVLLAGLLVTLAAAEEDHPASRPQSKPAAESGPSVSGRVLDRPSGKGAEGVVISLVHGNGERSYTTRTDKQGNYSFRNVVPSSHCYCLSIARLPPGVGMTWVPITVARKDIQAEDLYLARPQSVSGTVRDARTGKPVAGVGVFFWHHPRRTGLIRTDRQGRYKLYVPAGKATVCCRGGGSHYPPSRASERPIDVSVSQARFCDTGRDTTRFSLTFAGALDILDKCKRSSGRHLCHK